MQKTVIVSTAYAVSSKTGGNITDLDGNIISSIKAGEQVAFVATVPVVDIPDDAILTSVPADYSLAIGSLTGGSGGEPGSNASVAEHEANMVLHVSDDERQKWNDVADSSKSTYRWTSESTSENTEFCSLDMLVIATQGIQTEPFNQFEKPNGKFNKLELQFSKATEGWDVGETVYAVVSYANREEGKDVGVSKNAVQLTPGGKGVFEFDFDIDFTEENEYAVEIRFVRNKEDANFVNVGFDVDYVGWPNVWSIVWRPGQPYEITGRIFLGLEREIAHSEDTTVHVSDDERQKWNDATDSVYSPYRWTSEPTSENTKFYVLYPLVMATQGTQIEQYNQLEKPNGKFNKLELQFSKSTEGWDVGETVYALILYTDGDVARLMGASKNAVQLTPGGKGVFEFDFDLDFTEENKGPIGIYFSRSKELTDTVDVGFDIDVDSTSQPNVFTLYWGTGQPHEITGRIFLGLEGKIAHSEDTTVHVSDDERQKWNEVADSYKSTYRYIAEPETGNTTSEGIKVMMLPSRDAGTFQGINPFIAPDNMYNKLELQFSETTEGWGVGETVYAHIAWMSMTGNGVVTYMGCSKNAVQLTPGARGVFEFNFVIDFSGAGISIVYFRTDQEALAEGAAIETILGMAEVIVAVDMQKLSMPDAYINIMGVQADESMVYGRIFLDLSADLLHSENTSIHVTPGEKAKFNSALVNRALAPDSIAIGKAQARHDRSIAIGTSARTYGNEGMAIGYDTCASGDYSTAVGNESNSSQRGTAVGHDAYADIYSVTVGYGAGGLGHYSVAVGYNAGKAPNGDYDDYRTAIGCNTETKGNGATALGYEAVANRDYSTALGAATIAYGSSSTALGRSAEVTSTCTTALGAYSSAKVDYSTALGCFATATEANSIVLSARSNANTKFVLSLVAGTATGDAGSILSDTPFVTGSTLKLTISDGVSGISETLSIDAADLFTMLQSAGGTVTLTNPNA